MQVRIKVLTGRKPDNQTEEFAAILSYDIFIVTVQKF